MQKKTVSFLIAMTFLYIGVGGFVFGTHYAHAQENTHNQEATTTATSSPVANAPVTSTTTPDTTDSATSTEDATSSVETATTTTSVASTIPVHLHLDVETPTTTLFNDELDVSACSLEGATTTPTVTGYCALKQSGLANTWSLYGDDAFLDSLSGVANDYVGNNYWTWFSDLTLGMVALNKHKLTEGETLLVTIGKMPLAISLSTTTPRVGEYATATISYFTFDAAFNPEWLPATTTALLHINDSVVATNASGTAMFMATTSLPFSVWGTADGFVPTHKVLITPTTATSSESTTTSTATTTTPQQHASGNGVVANTEHLDVSAALRFLSDHQNADGSLGALYLTDWSAIAAVAGRDTALSKKIADYFAASPPKLHNITDFERHAMALLSLGVDPRKAGDTNYIQPILDAFDGAQIGDSNLVNDDIFALFPLLSVGYTEHDDLIKKEVAFIIARQGSNGSWESVDLTAAAVQALTQLSGIHGVTDALAKAEAFLHTQQKDDGGFTNSYATSWVAQAIAALGSPSSSWAIHGNTTQTFLANLQQVDGGIEVSSTDLQSRIWATAFAIPAELGTPWSNLLHAFSKEEAVSTNTTASVQRSAATTTIPTASSTTATTTNVVPVPSATTSVVATPTPVDMTRVTARESATTTPQHVATITHTSAILPPEHADEKKETIVEESAQLAAVATPASTVAGTLQDVLMSLWSRIVGFFSALFNSLAKVV